MTVIAYLFTEIHAAKNIVTEMSQQSCFKGPLDRQEGKWVKTIEHAEWKNLYHIF